MSPSMRSLFTISRPRFWIYLAGPYLVGMVAELSTLSDLTLGHLVWGFFFVFPANLFLYGINDIFDFETDSINEKKQGYESLTTPSSHKKILGAIILIVLPFVFALPLLSLQALGVLLLFILLSWQYSARPFRFKSIPFLDSLSNILYILPGVIAYLISSQAPLQLEPILAAFLWVVAMHAYSAIPDIAADTQAHIATTATTLGVKGTILYSASLYLLAALFVLPSLSWLALFLGAIYLALMFCSYYAPTEKAVFRMYRLFPFINTLNGTMIVLFLLGEKFIVR